MRIWRKHSHEVLEEAKRLYNSGLPLTKVSIQVKVPYATLHYHAWVQGWMRANGETQKAVAAKVRRKLAKEEKQISEALALAKVQDVEVLAKRANEGQSERTRAAISYQVGKLLKELSEDKTLSVKERAQTLNALSSVVKIIHGIEAESGDSGKGAINLALINTTPAELKALSEGKAG